MRARPFILVLLVTGGCMQAAKAVADSASVSRMMDKPTNEMGVVSQAAVAPPTSAPAPMGAPIDETRSKSTLR